MKFQALSKLVQGVRVRANLSVPNHEGQSPSLITKRVTIDCLFKTIKAKTRRETERRLSKGALLKGHVN